MTDKVYKFNALDKKSFDVNNLCKSNASKFPAPYSAPQKNKLQYFISF